MAGTEFGPASFLSRSGEALVWAKGSGLRQARPAQLELAEHPACKEL